MHQRSVAVPDSGTSARATSLRLRRRLRSRHALALLAATVIAFGMPGAAAAEHKHAPAKHASAAAREAAREHVKADRGAHREHGAAGSKRQDAKRSTGKHDASAGHHDRKDTHAVPMPPQRPAAGSPDASPDAASVVTLSPELAATKQAIELIRQRRFSEVAAEARAVNDPLAQKLVEWTLLRNPDSDASLARYLAFIRTNPDWPGIGLLHRRMEARLWQERQDRRDLATVRRLIAEPSSAAGRLALAQAEMREGYRASAESRARAVWRSAEMSPEMEASVLAAFPGVLTRTDHIARMDRRIGARDFGAAMRAAKLAGDDYPAIVNACMGVVPKSGTKSGTRSGTKSGKSGTKSGTKSGAKSKAKSGTKSAKDGTQFDQVPAGMRSDLGYALCRLHWLLRNDVPGSNIGGRIVTPKADIAAAVKLVLAASPEDLERQDTDEWWRVRRTLARKLLDLDDPQTAYRVVRGAATPANPYYRADLHFMPGWIALRFLNDPATALQHFALVDQGSTDPIVLSRAAYWRGRAAEAAGHVREMRAQYERAASFPTAYYGQLARARMGLTDIAVLRPPPEHAPGVAAELVHAADILYQIDEKGLVRSFVSELAEESGDVAALAALGQLTAQHEDAQSMLILGRTALTHGHALDQYAFPAIGVPAYGGGKLDRCIVYSIVRTESSFDQHDKSAAKAVGLMQVTPAAGRDTAKRFGMTYDWDRMVNDPVYNTQMGAAELAALLGEYRGSYIMTFAGYNAGRGRVRQWVALHGDPRDPKVDAVDWVERIPFSETRNYVQRVMENLQVYRARFGANTSTVEPNLHRAATLD